MTIEGYFGVHGDERDAYLEAQTPDALLQLGIDLYNAGHYWNAHEAWERSGSTPSAICVASTRALSRSPPPSSTSPATNSPAAIRLLDAGIEKLEQYPATFHGVQLSDLLRGAKAAHSRLWALGEQRIGEFDRALIPGIETDERQ